MQILKIENEKGFFSTNGLDFELIDKITKDDIMTILDKFVTEDCEMNEYDEAKIKNPAHQIIYSHIYKKFDELSSQKRLFIDEGDALYKEAIDKYSE